MEAELKIKDGKLIKVKYSVETNLIKQIQFTGDFFMIPEESIIKLEDRLNDTLFKEDILKRKITSFFNSEKITLIGIKPKHFFEVIMLARQTNIN